MHAHLLVAGIAAAALVPSFAFAQQHQQQQPCEPRHAATTSGTTAGGSIGAAVTGALLGAVLGRPAVCAQAYGYYDANGIWHANAVNRAEAAGYYDRDGRWVNGAPNGHYDAQGRWVPAQTNANASGYYDRNGQYVPASANAYYDTNGQLVGGAASGYYDRNGRWVAGPATGQYDAQGRWIPGQARGHRDANGVWVADAQPGYYDAQGSWHVGQASGYYDAQGRWVATGPAPSGYASAHADGGIWAGAPIEITARRAWLGERIRSGMREGTLSQREGVRALQALNVIRREETALRNRRGMLNARNESTIRAKLDAVNAGLRWSGEAYSRMN